MSLTESLSRTTLLMRDDLVPHISETQLIGALAGTKVLLTLSPEVANFHAAQCAYVTTALLLARAGHTTTLDAPNVKLIHSQPPLQAPLLLDALDEVGRDLLPGNHFEIGNIDSPDIQIVIGPPSVHRVVGRQLYLSFTDHLAELWTQPNRGRIRDVKSPLGALGASALAAGEVFKLAMRSIAGFAREPTLFDELYAPTEGVAIQVAPPRMSLPNELGAFDVISAGAISNAAGYTLSRLPGVNGNARIFDDDRNAISNLNRNMFLRRSQVGDAKVDSFSRNFSSALKFVPVPQRFGQGAPPLLDRALLGVDDIPARWAVQKCWPAWLGIGATSHYLSMSSFHLRDNACAGCLHPKDDDFDGPIPTVAFVSFWAGLILASMFLQSLEKEPPGRFSQSIFLYALRPESIWQSPVAYRSDCAVDCRRNRPRGSSKRSAHPTRLLLARSKAPVQLDRQIAY